MKIRHLVVLSAALLFAGNALADEALLKKSNCVTCHNMEKKTVGPSLKAIAAKYSGDATAQAKLEAKVRSGGKGSFGTMDMPKTGANVSDADIKTLVSWILAIK
ncbi:MAG: c-type cytochrome [Gallionellaceae bacterium]|jgi:cytochrome c